MGASSTPVSQFCAELRIRWQASGKDLHSIAQAVSISRTQLYAILNGEIKRPPDFERLVRPFVLACGAAGAELAEWRHRHAVVVGVYEGLKDRAALRPARPNQLPALSGPFVGRSALLTALDLATEPLVVVTGPPGVGKTALVVHWAYGRAESFPHGRLYADLRGFARDGEALDPAEAVRGFLDAMGVAARDVPPDPAAQAAQLRSLLADRRVLVVLDNARDADQVRPLLVGGAGVRVVVTSRGPLTPLVVDYAAAPIAVDLPTKAEAQDLFRSRLAHSESDSSIAEAVAACGRLPLALTLTAARVRQTGFPMATVAAELRRAGTRAHAELQTVFAGSYGAVSPPTARLFRLLGLTAGPDIAAEAVAALAGVHDARAELDDLIESGLLVEHRPGRYLMHDLTRDYADERSRAVDTDDERRAALTRLLDYYTRTAHEADRTLNPIRPPIPIPLPPAEGSRRPDYQTATAWLERERAVLLATLRKACNDGLDRYAWQLGWALDTFLYEHHRWKDEGAVWSIALRAATSLMDRAAAAHAHRFLGAVAGRLDNFADAYAHMSESMRLCRAARDQPGEAETEFVLSYVSFLQGRHATALAHAERSLALWSGLSDLRWTARAATAVGWYHAQRGDPAAAIPFFQRALADFHLADDHANEAVTRDNLGRAHHDLGAYAAALEQYDIALDLARQIADPVLDAHLTNHAGDAFQALGDHATARDRWAHACGLLSDAGHPAANDVARKLALLTPETGPS
ncbi:tetratricopeptide repeat protein [Hamadaea tsunoensis]|uniref:tetratricopeptide repeat protein n=1 Tax=Hamadaea tsunoensis TaxID=53368 RepID=UPI0004131842|nr:tetratricopeptide repeat protein [Hamadaea tsunoensis]